MFLIFSFSIKSIYRSVLIISGCVLAVITYGCTSQQIQYQALAHNQAFSASADKILLTNIIRASRIMPVDYTSITEYKAKEVASGSIVGKIPFGADALRAFSSDPTINIGPGIGSVDIKDFAQQKESFAKLYEDVEIQNFVNLRDAGWSEQLIQTVLFQNIRIRGAFARELIKRSNDICDEVRVKDPNQVQCKMIAEAMSCGDKKEDYDNFLKELEKQSEPRWGGYVVNSGDRKCQFLEFQSMLARLSILKIQIDVESAKKIVPYFYTEPKKYLKSIKKIYEETNDDLSGKNRNALEIVVRSTHLMVRYMGQLARAQLLATGEESWVPAIYDDDGNNKTPLFVVGKGYLRQSDSAISVEVDGQTYGIPTVYDDKLNKSLHLFTFVRFRLDQAYAQAKLPPSNTLILR